MNATMKDLKRTAGLLKALGHPARLQIANMLRHGEACVCHLEAHLGYRQPYISQHIMVMRKAGLLAERRDGTYMFYRLADPRVAELLDAMLPEAAMSHGLQLESHVVCCCPHCEPLAKAHP
jgi:ArsR family transcriptional regulator